VKGRVARALAVCLLSPDGLLNQVQPLPLRACRMCFVCVPLQDRVKGRVARALAVCLLAPDGKPTLTLPCGKSAPFQDVTPLLACLLCFVCPLQDRVKGRVARALAVCFLAPDGKRSSTLAVACMPPLPPVLGGCASAGLCEDCNAHALAVCLLRQIDNLPLFACRVHFLCVCFCRTV
jgi:hypothetical protein